MRTINIIPNPRILEVITHNPMPPVNALCELIDNSIDGFGTAQELGIEIKKPTIDVTLPTRSEVSENIGRLVVRDNGPGLSKEEANDAIRAGYSGNVPIGRLGLFGMGFNISTGKLGKKTVFKTARTEDNIITCITINIPELIKGGTFDVPVDDCPKPSEGISGVEVEISDWWEKGNQNYGFIKKLVGIGIPKIVEQVGRRYSTLLRKNLHISINGRRCPLFHHCAWGSNRYVERKGHGRIHARFDFKERLRTEKRCYSCGDLIPANEDICKKCGTSEEIKTQECVIKGWVGIQRFDDPNRFGLDFIRNGRAILIDEKEAVFTWTPEDTGQKIKEYPVDGIYGRIIGEVHIDHVPTDFLKTDFQRTSPEWAEVIKFLRGESSVLPETQRGHGEPENNSPIYKLFQGYRKVRRAGRTDMYMGYWDESKGAPSRITRIEEEELYEKFLTNEVGYGPRDDSRWWALVERADIRPTPEMKECPDCGLQCLKEADQCRCGHIYFPKKCIECGQDIAHSAPVCPHCNKSQIPDEEREWVCCSCTRRNPPDAFKCRRCNLPRGVKDTFKFEYLKENSTIVESLSHKSFSIGLPGGIPMSALNLKTYYLNRDTALQREGLRLPAVVHCFSDEIHIFLDQTHPLYHRYQDRPEDIISIEVANWIWQFHQGRISDSNRPLWSHSNLYYLIHSGFWGKRVELDSEEVSKEVKEFFKQISDVMPQLFGETAPSIYENMEAFEKSRVIEYLHKNNLLHRHEELIKNGEFLNYLPEDMVVRLFTSYPGKFFDGKFWKEPYEKLDVPDPLTLQKIREETAGKYQRCLEDMIAFSGYRNPDINYIKKINQTLRMVREYLA